MSKHDYWCCCTLCILKRTNALRSYRELQTLVRAGVQS
jgi:hypothetical protein